MNKKERLAVLSSCLSMILPFMSYAAISGDLAARIDLVGKRMQGAPFSVELVTEDVTRMPGRLRRFEQFEGDVSGRTLAARSLRCRLLGTPDAGLGAIAETILSCQRPDGHFGIDQSSAGYELAGAQAFGHGRLLNGLVQYYRLTGDGRFLVAARNLGNWFVEQVPQWDTVVGNIYTQPDEDSAGESGPVAWPRFYGTHQVSVLESLVELFRVDGDRRFLAAAQACANLLPDYGCGRWHSHSYLNALSGMVDLAAEAHDPGLLARVLRIYHRDIAYRTVRPDGAVPEFWPVDSRTEGCSLGDWIRLNLRLWRATRDGCHLDAAERCWLNAFNFHLTGEGAGGHALMTSDGYGCDYVQSWWCCTEHALQTYLELAGTITEREGKRLFVNFFSPCLQNGIRVETDYPASGMVRIEFQEGTEADELVIHVPWWARRLPGPVVLVNGRRFSARPGADGLLRLTRFWKAGDSAEIVIPMPVRAEDAYGNAVALGTNAGWSVSSVYLFKGPLLLCAPAQGGRPSPATIRVQGPHGAMPKGLVPLGNETWAEPWRDELSGFRRTSEEPVKRRPVRIRFDLVRDDAD